MAISIFRTSWVRAAAIGLVCWWATSILTYANPPTGEAGEPESFYLTEVLPILQAHCYSCHASEPGDEVDSDFNMVTRELFVRGGAGGPVIDTENWANSSILRAINYDGLEMPPRGKLPRAQIDVLTRWVKMGLPWQADAASQVHAGSPVVDDRARQFWSFQPVTSADPPQVADGSFVKTPIDRFVLAKLEENGLHPAPPARQTTLLRRVYYALVGLPPSPAQVAEFLADDSPNAYERVVDRLLASPQYGERWARHWLDLVRYAETDGYEFDRVKPEVWRYRDYVIDSFNNDKPYDQFLQEQLAGDELDGENAEAIIATGFYKLGPRDGGAADRLQAEFDELDDIVSTTGQVMLGLTMNCARCHDHKVDPIPTADYYRFLAFFRGIQRGRGSSTRPIQLGTEGGDIAKAIGWEERFEAVERKIRLLEYRVAKELTAGEKDDFEEESNRPMIIRANSPQYVSAAQLSHYEAWLVERAELKESRPAGLARALCVIERGPKPPDTHILLRGSPYAEGDLVQPGFPSVLATAEPQLPVPDEGLSSSGRRRVLADWIASPQNPLTARVIVNRLWHYHFDRGIVRSTSDFGYGGTPPTHPELLDWLATQLVENEWRLKPLHKMIVMSSTFQMSSTASDAAIEADPENDLFTRFQLRRLEAEEIRDSILAVSGNLNLKSHGPSIYPAIAEEVLAGQSRPGQGWRKSTPEEQARRSVYVHVKRSLLLPILAVFDAADTDSSCPARFATTQPTQALTMLNSDFLNRQASIFADDLKAEFGDQHGEQVHAALRRVTQREPTEVEIERGIDLMRRLHNEHGIPAEQTLQKFCLLAMNLNEFLCID